MNGCYYNDEIEVGDFFRSESCGIMRFIYGTSYIEKDDKVGYAYYLQYENGKTMPLSLEALKKMKHSQNLIDLIEVRRLCKWRKSNLCFCKFELLTN